jgi:hypothetical protein
MPGNNFITNSDTKSLKDRISQLVQQSSELKFLVGFFYFSGINELYKGIKANSDLSLKVLVGMKVDILNSQLIEVEYNESLSREEKINIFFESIRRSINTDYFDTKEFYEQSHFFIKMIESDRLIIRKAIHPNHAKLYLFKLKEEQVSRNELFITGSSNLTRAV